MSRPRGSFHEFAAGQAVERHGAIQMRITFVFAAGQAVERPGGKMRGLDTSFAAAQAVERWLDRNRSEAQLVRRRTGG